MQRMWIKPLVWMLTGTVLGLALVYGVKTFVTHTAVDWSFLWSYLLVDLAAYGLLVGVWYVRRDRRR